MLSIYCSKFKSRIPFIMSSPLIVFLFSVIVISHASHVMNAMNSDTHS